MPKNDTTYARVSPIKGGWTYEKNGQHFYHVGVTIFLPHWKPNYAIGTHLLVTTNKVYYQIYNPQRLKFEYMRLISSIRNAMIRDFDEELLDYRIIDA